MVTPCSPDPSVTFPKIVVPFLDDKSAALLGGGGDVGAVGHCLGLVCGLLEHPDMLEHCHKQKLLKMVVEFRVVIQNFPKIFAKISPKSFPKSFLKTSPKPSENVPVNNGKQAGTSSVLSGAS